MLPASVNQILFWLIESTAIPKGWDPSVGVVNSVILTGFDSGSSLPIFEAAELDSVNQMKWFALVSTAICSG